MQTMNPTVIRHNLRDANTPAEQNMCTKLETVIQCENPNKDFYCFSFNLNGNLDSTFQLTMNRWNEIIKLMQFISLVVGHIWTCWVLGICSQCLKCNLLILLLKMNTLLWSPTDDFYLNSKQLNSRYPYILTVVCSNISSQIHTAYYNMCTRLQIH